MWTVHTVDGDELGIRWDTSCRALQLRAGLIEPERGPLGEGIAATETRDRATLYNQYIVTNPDRGVEAPVGVSRCR